MFAFFLTCILFQGKLSRVCVFYLFNVYTAHLYKPVSFQNDFLCVPIRSTSQKKKNTSFVNELKLLQVCDTYGF